MKKQTNSFADELNAIDKNNQAKEAMETEIVDEVKEGVRVEENKEMEEVYKLLNKEVGVTKEQILDWKDMYFGKVFVFRIDDRETYIYRYMARPEWKAILNSFGGDLSNATEEQINEQIFNKHVLYPKVDQQLKQRLGAGTIDAVALAIRLVSNFLPEEHIARSIIKL